MKQSLLFSDRLRTLMNQRGLKTDVALAKATGLSHVTIGNYLKRGRTPDPEPARILAQFFSISTDDLLYGKSDQRFSRQLKGIEIILDALPISEDQKQEAFSQFVSSVTNLKVSLRSVQEQLNDGQRALAVLEHLLEMVPDQTAKPDATALTDKAVTELTVRGQGRQGAEKALEALRLKPKAVSTTGKTSAREHPARPAKGARRHPPSPAPAAREQAATQS